MSAAEKDVLHNVEDYLMGRGRFDRSEYYGMRGSQISELLADYCGELSAPKQKELIRILAEVAVGKREQFTSYLHLAPAGLAFLCLKGFQKQFDESVVGLLESEFVDPANVEMWRTAGEMTEPTGGGDFKRTWHYAAALSFLLKLVGSELASSVRQYLIEHAKSEDFKETLKRHG